MSEPTKRCPMCGEEILAVAIKCKHCQSMIQAPPPPQVALPHTPMFEGEPTRVCPKCGGTIFAAAQKCRHCGALVVPTVHRMAPLPTARRSGESKDAMTFLLGLAVMVTLGVGIWWYFSHYESDEDKCTKRGILYFKQMEMYPNLDDGRDAASVARERCNRTTTAFPEN